MSTEPQVWLEALVNEVAAAVGALAKGTAEAGPGEAAGGPQWVATLAAAGRPGHWRLVIDGAGAARLGALASSAAGDDDAAVAEMIRGIVSKAAAALAGHPADDRIELSLVDLERIADWSPADGSLIWAIAVPGLEPPLVIAAAGEPRADSRAPEDTGNRIDVILDIDLPVVVRFGHTELPIRALSRLGPGSVIDLGRSPDDPVEVLVSNRVVARGEVVIVGGNYGVRILDVASRSERARSMEA